MFAGLVRLCPVLWRMVVELRKGLEIRMGQVWMGDKENQEN